MNCIVSRPASFKEFDMNQKMSDNFNYIPELKGVDAEIFLHALDEDISLDEIEEVREWANR